MDSVMITTGEGVKDSRGGKGGMAHIHEDVIQTRVHGNVVAVNLMKGMVGGSSTCESSVRKRSEQRKQMRPSLEKLDGRRRTAITDRVRIGIPITNQKVIRGVKIGSGGEGGKKGSTIGTIGVGVNVGNLKNLPLEAKCCR
jgi:hypothetical protein